MSDAGGRGDVLRRVELRLYVTGGSPGAPGIIDAVHRLLAERCPVQHELHIVDLGDDPSVAIRDGVLATPTLVRTAPTPVCRVVGDLTDIDAVWSAIAG